MKKAILVVSFGTSYTETRIKTIDVIESKIKNTFGDYEVRKAYTSNMIINKLKNRDNIIINNPMEAINKLVSDGYDNIHVQSLHVIPGYEYDKLKNTVELAKCKHKIEITIGSPLLNKEHHYNEVVSSVLKDLPSEKDGIGIILMGHGTEHYANACYSMLQCKFNDIRNDIMIANVEGYPEIDHIIEKVKLKFSKVILMPFMIVAGDHAINDMAGNNNSYKSKLESCNIEVECILKGLGENIGIQEAYINRIKECIN